MRDCPTKKPNKMSALPRKQSFSVSLGMSAKGHKRPSKPKKRISFALHGRGHRFDPCRAHHFLAAEILQFTQRPGMAVRTLRCPFAVTEHAAYLDSVLAKKALDATFLCLGMFRVDAPFA